MDADALIRSLRELAAKWKADKYSTYGEYAPDELLAVLDAAERTAEPQIWTRATYDLAIGTLADIALSRDLTLPVVRRKAKHCWESLRGIPMEEA